MNLAICGDSWFCGDRKYPGRSFGEILCDQNDWNLISLAIGGCSAFAICLQIDKAIEMHADFVVIGTTTPDRLDIPILNCGMPESYQKIRDLFDWDNFFHNSPGVFDPKLGISNIDHGRSYLSSENSYAKTYRPTIYSATMANLFWHQSIMLTDQQQQALKLYMLNLYDRNVKNEIDIRLYNNACSRLEHANIPYLLCIEPIDDNDTLFPQIAKEKIMTKDQFQYGALPRSDAQFHYCHETGGHIFADYIATRITDIMEGK